MSNPTPDYPTVQEASQDVAQDVPGVVKDVKSGDYVAVAGDLEHGYSTLSPLVPHLVQEAKAGYKTTEFWLVIAYEILTQSGAIHLPGTWGKLVAGVSGLVAYVLSRGIAKSGTPNEVPVK
jgi:hypothetical protein